LPDSAVTAPPFAAASHRGQLDDALFLACGLAWGACLIHGVAAIEHAREYMPYSIFFALLACAQLWWGIAVYRRPAPKLLLAGAVVSLMVVALWIVSRTAGLPIGPRPWTPESVGAIDSFASADEILLALVVLFQLRPGRRGALARAFRYVVSASGICLVLLSSLAFTLGGHGH
jgi:hypothetical protein